MASLKYEPVAVASAVRAVLAAAVAVGAVTLADAQVESVVAVFAAGGVVETVVGFLTRRKTASKVFLQDFVDFRTDDLPLP